MNKKDRFSFLLQQYVSGIISTDEHDELFGLLSTHEYDTLLEDYIQNDLKENYSGKNADLPPHIAQEIIRNIFNAEKNTAKILPIKKPVLHTWRMVAAAAVIIIAFSVYLFTYSDNKISKQSFAEFIPGNTIIQKNISQSKQVVVLSDGSTITLNSHSTLHYPKIFSADKREIYLEGEAFFQVAKNPQKPFLVYYNNIVTKVLGTSFSINTNLKTGNVEVAVKTGRVQVYENDKLVKADAGSKAVIITPNQKAIYKIENRTFETTLVEKPLPVSENEHNDNNPLNGKQQSFIYDQEKLLNVFNEIEARFKIDIVIENANLNNCVFTGDLSGDDLFKMLTVISLTTNSSYEINGTKILIKGKGCN